MQALTRRSSFSSEAGGIRSFRDGANEEEYLDLLYYKNEGRWTWNDAPNDILAVVPSFSGRIGYICEYED